MAFGFLLNLGRHFFGQKIFALTPSYALRVASRSPKHLVHCISCLLCSVFLYCFLIAGNMALLLLQIQKPAII